MTRSDVVGDRSRRSGGWRSLFFGLVFCGVGGYVSTGIFRTVATGAGAKGVLAGCLAGLLVVGGLAAVVHGVRDVWLSHVLGTPTLTVPPTEPLLLGGVLVARFERTGGSARSRQQPRLSAELVCEEKVSYRQGNDRHTATKEILRRELATTTDPTPGRVAGEIVVEVPVDVPPSMTLPHNEIVWSVVVRVQTTGVPDDRGTFAVPVRPALAARALGGEPR